MKLKISVVGAFLLILSFNLSVCYNSVQVIITSVTNAVTALSIIILNGACTLRNLLTLGNYSKKSMNNTGTRAFLQFFWLIGCGCFVWIWGLGGRLLGGFGF